MVVVLAVDDDEDDELGVVVGSGLVDVVVGVHEALTLFTGLTPAGTIDEGGVPGGTLTLKVSVCPVTSVTVTVHSSAEAVGRFAIPITANADTTEMAAVFSLRLLDNLTRLLPPSQSVTAPMTGGPATSPLRSTAMAGLPYMRDSGRWRNGGRGGVKPLTNLCQREDLGRQIECDTRRRVSRMSTTNRRPAGALKCLRQRIGSRPVVPRQARAFGNVGVTARFARLEREEHAY